MLKTIKLLSLTACLCLFFGLLAGCGAEQSSEEVAAEPVEETVSYDLTIGTETDEVVSLPVKNATKQAITSFEVKSIDVTDFPSSMLKAGEAWEPDATAEVYFDGVAIVADETAIPEDDETSANESADENVDGAEAVASDDEPLTDVILNPLYDIRFTLADGKSYVLHQMNLNGLIGAEDIALNVDPAQDLGYLTYTSDGTDVSTLSAEEQIKAQIEAAEAQAQAEAEAARLAEEEAARQAAAANSAAANRSNSGGYDSVGSSGSGSGSGAPSQSEDSCIDAGDLVLN